MSERTISKRAEFYLRNKKRIDEWAALRKDMELEAHAFFRSLAEPLDEAAAELAGEPQLFKHLERTEPPKLFLVSERWLPHQSGHPLCGIGLEWPKSSPTFSNPYLGIWVNARAADRQLAPVLSPMLTEALTPVLASLRPKFKQRRSLWWPAWRYERAPAEFWADLDGHAADLVENISELWLTANEVVDECLAGARAALDRHDELPESR